MKKIRLSILLLFLFPLCLLAQETVHPITVVERENEFYVEQMRLWKKVTEREPGNVEAWRNLYHAARYKDFPAIFNDSTYKKEVSKIVQNMAKAIPNTYEAYYIQAWHNGFGEENFDLLMAAYRIDSTRPKIWEDLFTHHYRLGEWEKADHYMRKWYGGKSLAPQLLHFCYNLLACTEENGILFTSGDNDSYPTWMLQSAQEVRPDVAALNAYLMLDPDFAQKALERYGIKADAATLALLKRGKDMWQNFAEFVRRLARQNPGRRIYLPITMQKEAYEALKDDLYVVGSVFEYCDSRYDNIATLKRNWHQNMRLDYLDFITYADDYLYTPAGLPYTVIVYMYPSMTLYKHYKASGEMQRAEEMLKFAKKISNQLGDADHYKRFLEGGGK